MSTQKDILASIDLELGGDSASTPQEPQGNYFGNLLRTGGGQGFLLGLGDELEAGLEAQRHSLPMTLAPTKTFVMRFGKR